jgi:hypothetical protein
MLDSLVLFNFINVNYQLDAGWHRQTISKDQQCDVFTRHYSFFVICISSLNTQGCLSIKMHFTFTQLFPNMPKLNYSEIKALIFHIYIISF